MSEGPVPINSGRNGAFDRGTLTHEVMPNVGSNPEDWLEEVVGETPYAGVYLDTIRDIRADLIVQQSTALLDGKERLAEEYSDALHHVNAMTSHIAMFAENRLNYIAKKNGGYLPVEFEGIEPLRAVTEEDINKANNYPEGSALGRLHEYVSLNASMRLETEEPPRPEVL